MTANPGWARPLPWPPWTAWTAGRLPRRVEPWLATICLNAGRDQLRRASTRLELPAGSVWELPGSADVEAEAIARAWRTRVEQAMWRLPAEQRIAIALMDLGGFTAAEVAKLTGSPRGTVLARVPRDLPPARLLGGLAWQRSSRGEVAGTYKGQIAADLWRLGQWWSGLVARCWEQTVAASLATVKAEAERRAAAAARRRSRPQQPPPAAGG
jgi:hypothetical protein